MISMIRMLLAAEAVVFGIASSIHAGVLLSGYEHREARIAETVIAVVLLAGLVVTLAAPSMSRRAGLLSQGFALLGTIVGAVMIAIGVGPRSALDYALHTTMIVLLVSGIVVVLRESRRNASMHAA